jgi:cysteine synthase A
MAAPVVDSVLEIAAETPLVRLSMGGPAAVWAKCEHLLPSGSLKDRVADAALARANVKAGDTVVVASSGSTAAAVAIAARLRGVKVIATMPRSMALEKRSLLRGLGVELVLTDAALAMHGARVAARRIATERGASMLSLEGLEGARATADEIVSALAGVPDAIVVGVGSGATLRAIASALRARGPVRVIGVLATKEDTRIAGLAHEAPSDLGADELRRVDDEVAWTTSRRLAREEGLLVGPSAGACVSVACAIAAPLDADRRVVAILGDTGERYFSIAQFFPAGAST